MSPVFLVSVIDFLMFPALDTAHDGVAFCFFKHFQIPGLCVGMDILLTDTLMLSFMGGVTLSLVACLEVK